MEDNESAVVTTQGVAHVPITVARVAILTTVAMEPGAVAIFTPLLAVRVPIALTTAAEKWCGACAIEMFFFSQ